VTRFERVLLVATPAAAMAAVALGLRIGAGTKLRAAVVFAAPQSDAGTGMAWQLATFEEARGLREPIAAPGVTVVARTSSREVRWQGATNEDGVAEVALPLSGDDAVRLEVTSDATLLASGQVRRAPDGTTRPAPTTAWARFARRDGPVMLDVAVLGERVASGFPAVIWVRATDRASGAPLAGVSIEPEADSSLVPASPSVRTDARGWAEIIATPVGHAVTMTFNARSAEGRRGVWAGALFVSPGAAQLRVRQRIAPEEEPLLEVVVPTVRRTAYVEVDDSKGRAWAAVLNLSAEAGAMPRAKVRAPRLAPGLYWAVVSGDPAGAAQLGPGTLAQPFAVAATDAAALAFGLDPSVCAPPLDPRDSPRVLSVCLALSAARPVPRWVALEGFSQGRATEERRRARGLGLALTAIALAVILEGVLVFRAALATRARLRVPPEGAEAPLPTQAHPAWTVAVALLVGVLGLVLLAAFVARSG
jgi:hypothetical protein